MLLDITDSEFYFGDQPRFAPDRGHSRGRIGKGAIETPTEHKYGVTNLVVAFRTLPPVQDL